MPGAGRRRPEKQTAPRYENMNSLAESTRSRRGQVSSLHGTSSQTSIKTSESRRLPKVPSSRTGNTFQGEERDESPSGNHSMNTFQRRVLGRKKGLIAEALRFSVLDQKKYRELGLLNDSMLANIVSEPSEHSQVLCWLSQLHLLQGGDTFNQLVQLLDKTGYGWIADELRIDLLAESGELEVEEYVYREAGTIVHRHFGQSKRISESDKREMQAVIALRYQAAKQAWHQHYLSCQAELEDALKYKKTENGRMKGLADKISAYLRIQKKHINKYAHDLTSGVDTLKEDFDPDASRLDYFVELEKKLDNILEVLSRVLLQKEKFEDERKRCLTLLKLDKPVIHLDLAFQEVMGTMSEDLSRYQRDALLSDRTAKTLDSTVKTLQCETSQELANMERHVAYLDSVIRKREERLQQLEKLYLDAKVKHDDVEEEVSKWKRRCEMLEKTRRLGYMNPGWSERIKDVYEHESSPRDTAIQLTTTNLPVVHNKSRVVRTDTELNRQSVDIGWYQNANRATLKATAKDMRSQDAEKRTSIIYDSSSSGHK